CHARRCWCSETETDRNGGRPLGAPSNSRPPGEGQPTSRFARADAPETIARRPAALLASSSGSSKPLCCSRAVSCIDRDRIANRAKSIAAEQGAQPRVDRRSQGGTFVDEARIKFLQARTGADVRVGILGSGNAAHPDNGKLCAGPAANRANHVA